MHKRIIVAAGISAALIAATTAVILSSRPTASSPTSSGEALEPAIHASQPLPEPQPQFSGPGHAPSSATIETQKPVATRQLPPKPQTDISETPLAPAAPETVAATTPAEYNVATKHLARLLGDLSRYRLFHTFDGLCTVAVHGNSLILATSDGTVVFFNASPDGRRMETSTGASIEMLAENDQYTLGRIVDGAYVVFTPTGQELTLGGTQNREAPSLPFSAPTQPVTSPLAALAKLRTSLTPHHSVYASEDKQTFLVVDGTQRFLISDKATVTEFPKNTDGQLQLKTSSGTTCTYEGGDDTVAVGQASPDAFVALDSKGTETPLTFIADAKEYDVISSDLNNDTGVPPSEEVAAEGATLEYTGLGDTPEYAMSMYERRLARRLRYEQ